MDGILCFLLGLLIGLVAAVTIYFGIMGDE